VTRLANLHRKRARLMAQTRMVAQAQIEKVVVAAKPHLQAQAAQIDSAIGREEAKAVEVEWADARPCASGAG
jgi:hypothetical protein